VDPSDRAIHDVVLGDMDVDGRLRDEEDDQFRFLTRMIPKSGQRCSGRGHA
jgi:hypothetical protein